MTWTKPKDSLPTEYTHILIKWESKSTGFEFITTGFYDGKNWHSTSTDLIVTDDLKVVEWRKLE